MSKDKTSSLAIDFSKFTDEDLEAYEEGNLSALSDKALEALADYEDKFAEISGKVGQYKEPEATPYGLTTAAAGTVGALATGVAPKTSQQLVDKMLPEDLRGGYKAPAATAPVVAKPPVAPAPGADYFSPFGAGEGAVKNATHNVDEVLKNKVAQAAIKTPGYVAPGNSLILQPSSSLPPPAAPATGSPVLPNAAKPKVGMPQMRAALQSPNVAPANRLPSSIKGGAAAGFGANAIEEAQRGNYGDAATSAIGSGSSIAALASNPKLARAGKLGMAATILGKGYQSMQGREEKAEGGLIGYAAGKAVKGGLDAAKKLAPAAGKARELVEPTAEEIAKFVPKPTKQGKFSDFIQNHMDEYLGIHQSDRLGTHGDYMGGTNFPNFQNINPLHAKNKVVWMNNDPNASNKIIKNTTYNDKPVVWTNYIGKEDQHKSNRGVFNEILADVYKNNPDITEEQALKIAERMRTLIGKDLDIRDKFMMQEIGGDTFDSRGKLAEMFGLGFGRGKDKLVLSPNYQNILMDSSEEFTRGAPTSAIGTRLHRVFDEPSQYSTKFHPNYDYTVHGEDMGVQFPAVPHTVLDWTQKYIKEGRGGKGSKIPHGNAWFNYMSDPQHITEEFVKRAQSEGFAEGGEVKGYNKGKIVEKVASKLILPPAENAARTQIIGTLPTYEKAGSILQQRGAAGRGIDFGAGLGEGAKALGKDFDTYEPFAKNWTPTYSNAADVPSDAYGRLTNLNVLNVVPREIRDEIVQDIGRVMEPGGMGIITTRGKDVMNAKGLAGPEPMSVITSRDTYQKGFNKDELEEYLKYMLGDKFDINRLNLGPAGALIKKKADGGLTQYKEGGSTTPAWQRKEGKNPEGGLNAAGRASYNRETGGNLKAPQPEGGPRKKSFCARMEGMKKKNTSSATANDPDSRINKSLRKWKC
jgi:hypothetical protein